MKLLDTKFQTTMLNSKTENFGRDPETKKVIKLISVTKRT